MNIKPSVSHLIAACVALLFFSAAGNAQSLIPDVSIGMSVPAYPDSAGVTYPALKESGSDREAVVYPSDAIEEGVEGTVELDMVIGTDGSVERSRVLDDGGDSRLVRAAVEGLRRTGFTPATTNGVPMQMGVVMTVEFLLKEANVEFVAAPDIAEMTEIELAPPPSIAKPQERHADESGMDDFVMDARPPSYDRSELQSLVVYPALAWENGIEGRVTVSAQIGTSGEVLKVVIRQSTNKLFEENAKRAVRRLTFTPGTQNGKPLKMWVTFAIHFELEDPVPDSTAARQAAERKEMDAFVPGATPPTYSIEQLRQLVQYPELMRSNGIEGKVNLSVHVDADGTVLDVVPRGATHPGFVDEAVKTVRRLEFTPGVRDGQPIRMWVTIPIHFTLSD